MRFECVSDFLNYVDETINQTHGIIVICGVEFDAANVLKKMDPIAYRATVINFADSEGVNLDDLCDDADF